MQTKMSHFIYKTIPHHWFFNKVFYSNFSLFCINWAFASGIVLPKGILNIKIETM